MLRRREAKTPAQRPRKLLRVLLRIVAVAAGCLGLWIAVLAAASWRCNLHGAVASPRHRSPDRTAATAEIKNYLRPEDDSYLSYPEWYIVWSYQERADFLEKHAPSEFPYFSAAAQYWTSDCCIRRVTHGKYGFNGGEQAMLAVLGVSFSAEYIFKGIYEKSAGRFTEWTARNTPVEEDQYAFRMAHDYADFVHVRPFYEYRFARHINGLWRTTRLWGEHPVRKWERKIFLTTDYTVEAFYAWTIEKVTHLTYGFEPDRTYAWVDNADANTLSRIAGLKTVKQVGVHAFVVDAPRYQQFTAVSTEMAAHSVRFIEIAGNSQILISVTGPESWTPSLPAAQLLFSSPVLTAPPQRRFAINCDVESLDSILNSLRQDGVRIEHIYDY